MSNSTYDNITQVEINEHFSEFHIKIHYTKTIDFKKSENNRNYFITRISSDSENTDLQNFIKNFNERICSNSEYHSNWQLFYLYKELFQYFNQKHFNYFRGQNGNFPLCPGIFRESTTIDYRNKFESIYKKISFEFPNKVKYYPIEEEQIDSRTYQLSLLQHYGLKTSLLDITKDPYISMLFMLYGEIKTYTEPTIYLFRIPDDENFPSLFSEVAKNSLNERIIAQKGAFFNFDKLIFQKGSLTPIDTIKVSLCFDDREFKKYSMDSITRIEKLQKLIESEDSQLTDKGLQRLQTTLKNIVEKIKDKTDRIDDIKIECLKEIKSELLSKLKEYCYSQADLFPDFEYQIKYLASQYENKTNIYKKN